jgi:general control protein GCN4
MTGNSLFLSSSQIHLLTPHPDFDSLLTSFSSDMGAEQMFDGVFDTSSSLLGLDSLGGAELSAMPTGSDHTVSPQELALHDSPSLFGSAPPSGAFTNLTSPDMYNTSPDFGVDHLDNSWPSLFPGSDLPEKPTTMQRNFSHGSQSSDSPSASPAIRGVGIGSPRPSPGHRHSTSGVSKTRRRQGTLKEIVIDPGDKVAAKRARNTLAARDSRARKAQHVEILEGELAEARARIAELEALVQTQHSGHIH